MDEIKVARITNDSAELFENLLPENIINELKKGSPITAIAAIWKKHVVGALSGYVEDGDFRISSIYVHPKYRGKGAARAMIDGIKNILEDTEHSIIAEYTADGEEEQLLDSLFISCYFEDSSDEYPYFIESNLKDFKVRRKASEYRHEDIRLLSKMNADEIKKAATGELMDESDLMADGLIKEAGFVSFENGNITDCVLSEDMGNGKVRIRLLTLDTDNPERLSELLSYVEEALKEKYRLDTNIIVLIHNPAYEDYMKEIFKSFKVISHKYVF